MRDCQHVPPCPVGTARFVCGQRTVAEQAVAQGVITRDGALTLLAKYGVPMTAPSKVYRGDPPPAKQDGNLW